MSKTLAWIFSTNIFNRTKKLNPVIIRNNIIPVFSILYGTKVRYRIKRNSETLKIWKISIKILKPNNALCSLDFGTIYFPDVIRDTKSSNLRGNRIFASTKIKRVAIISKVNKSFADVYLSMASKYKVFTKVYKWREMMAVNWSR